MPPGTKWSAQQRRKFSKTMALKRRAKGRAQGEGDVGIPLGEGQDVPNIRPLAAVPPAKPRQVLAIEALETMTVAELAGLNGDEGLRERALKVFDTMIQVLRYERVEQ